MKREEPGSVGQGPAQPSANGLALERQCPTLARYMLDVQWDDGQTRLTSRLSVSMERGLWLVSLDDRNYARVLRVSVDSWGEVFVALEAALNAKPAPWQHAEWLVKHMPKKSGKKKT